jgi:uncharacterized protein YbjT (DUF2867 family)
MILVTGASGNVGSQVLKYVLETGQRAKALYRSSKDTANAPAGVATAIADFADPDSMERALEGVQKIFLACAPVPELVRLEESVIDACRRADVRHIVLNSALGAGTFDSSFPSWHAEVEDYLKHSGIFYTIIRPNSFMQNVVNFYAPTIRTQGTFYAAMGDAHVSFIDTRDIGAFVAQVLTSPGHESQVYELNGPEALTYADVASKVSRVAGRKVQYVDLPASKLRESMLQLGMPEWQVDALLELQRYYTGGGDGKVDDLVASTIGREPIHMDGFLSDFASEFREQAKTA